MSCKYHAHYCDAWVEGNSFRPSAYSYTMFKGKPGFSVKYKLQTIFTWNVHEVQQTNDCLHGTFKNEGSPYTFLYDSCLKLLKNEHELRGKSQQWDITLKLPTFFSPNLFHCEVFICSPQNRKESHRSPWILRKYHMWLKFYPIAVSIFNSSTSFLHKMAVLFR